MFMKLTVVAGRITQHIFKKLYEKDYFVQNTAKQPYCLKDERWVTNLTGSGGEH
jgi:methionyl-tRNA synthetase